MSSSKAIPKIVPWLNAQEWRMTRKNLYSESPEDVKLGILQAKIWMDRGKVPTAVESTVNFLEVILTDTTKLDSFLSHRHQNEEDENDIILENNIDDDEEDEQSSGNSDDRSLRLAYTSAIIRFVNELVDRAQKSLFATSITKLADQINLPRVFVDIRHDGTHDRLSSLELLRWAAWEALDWLEDQYWSFEDDLSSTTWTIEFNGQVHGLLNQFCEQLGKINDIQSAAALEKGVQSRLCNQIEFLQTLPRVMRAFLYALLEFRIVSEKNCDNVFEAIVRLLARNNPAMFYPLIIEVLLSDRKESDVWLPWILAELSKCTSGYNADTFASNLFKEFARKSSSILFKERLVKIWEGIGPLVTNEKLKNTYAVFERVYLKNEKKPSNATKFKSSKELVKKRKYRENEELESWAMVSDNWTPCPMGFSSVV